MVGSAVTSLTPHGGEHGLCDRVVATHFRTDQAAALQILKSDECTAR